MLPWPISPPPPFCENDKRQDGHGSCSPLVIEVLAMPQTGSLTRFFSARRVILPDAQRRCYGWAPSREEPWSVNLPGGGVTPCPREVPSLPESLVSVQPLPLSRTALVCLAPAREAPPPGITVRELTAPSIISFFLRLRHRYRYVFGRTQVFLLNCDRDPPVSARRATN